MTREEKVKHCSKLVERVWDRCLKGNMISSLFGDIVAPVDSDKYWLRLSFSANRLERFMLSVPAPDSAEGWTQLEERAVRFIAGCL